MANQQYDDLHRNYKFARSIENFHPDAEPKPSLGDYCVFFCAVAIMAVVVGVLIWDKLL